MSAFSTDFTTKILASGVVASTLSPFDDCGELLLHPISDQARRLGQIRGIIGIALNTTIREREILSSKERIEIIRRTREGLSSNQLLLSCVGELSDAVIDDVAACEGAGANAVITSLSKWQKGYDDKTLNQRIDAIVDLTDQLPLPVIIALGNGETRHPTSSEEIITLAKHSDKVIGFDMGADDNVLHYDQDYYALKAMDLPVACLSSSEGALFHNLNTGADGVLSCLAFVAPHEVAALYQASRCNRFPCAQAIHNRLSPLIALLSGHDPSKREMIYREAAHRRGLLSSPLVHGISTDFCPDLKRRIHSVIDEIGLKPIKWV